MLRRTLLTIAIALAPLTASAVEHGYLKLDDNAASTTVVATIGNNCTLEGGENTSGVQTLSGPGSLAYAFDLDGNDALVIGGIATINYTNGQEFTFSGWVNLDSLTAQPVWGRNTSSAGSISVLNSTTIRVVSSVATQDYTVPAMSTGTWYHIFITRAQTTNSLRVFLNGVESSTGPQAVAGGFNISRAGRHDTAYLDGRMSQLRFFNNDESANVATYYAEGSTSPELTITTSDTQTLEESERLVCALTATDGTEPYGWTITGGADAALFSVADVSGDPWLQLDGSADFENPDDADTNGVYVVEVTVTDDDSDTDALTISVTITDEGGGGVVDPLGGSPPL